MHCSPRSRRISSVAAFLTLLVIAACPCAWSDDTPPAAVPAKADAAPGDSQPDPHAAMNRGLSWLMTAQAPEGYWSTSNFPALTALGLWAFTRSDFPDKTGVCARAAAYIAQCAQPDGGIYCPATGGRGSGGLSTYNTAICMTALHAYDSAKYAPIILAARRFMAGCQIPGDASGAGGFGYDPPPKKADAAPGPMERRGARGDLSNTGWALQAMRVTQALEDLRDAGQSRVDVDWSRALKFVESLQNQDAADTVNNGGFGYAPTGERGGAATQQDGTTRIVGFGSMTYAGLESMIYAQVDRTDPRVKSALQWAALHWSVEENPGMGSKGLYYYYAIMGKSLSLTGAETLGSAAGVQIPWKRQLIDKLLALQRADGTWSNPDNTFWESDPVLVTAYAILTLEYATGK